MVAFSAVTNPTVSTPPLNRENTPVRDESASRERLETVRPSGSSAAKSEALNKDNQQKQQFMAESRASAQQSSPQGNRRGSLLDLSV